MEYVLILPTHLYEDNFLINKNTNVYIYEHPNFFTKFNYHKLKLILHRSTMKSYSDFIKNKYKCKVKYLEYNQDLSELFKKLNNKKLDLFDPVDHDIVKNLIKDSRQNHFELFIHNSPTFLATLEDLKSYVDQMGDKSFNQTSFYIWQRKRLNILIDKNGKPINGKWSFDKKNRLPFSNTEKIDQTFKINNNKYVIEAKNYIEKNFKSNLGESDFYFSTDHKSAKNHLKKFLKNNLECFGPYQDAVDKKIIFGCHSVLSPLVNIGLLTHSYVVGEILNFYNNSKNKKKIFYSVEAIIRQYNWANYCRMVYMFKHKELIKGNYFHNNRKINKKIWYNGEEFIIPPINDLIKKCLKYCYAHHIERLMFLGNFMLLCEMKPTDVYEWFSSMFIDSYPAFMETNVYGMSQFSAGKLMMTRPYFSSSNYLNKMSDYKRKKGVYPSIELKKNGLVKYILEWYEIWDCLYYNFIHKNKQILAKNYSTANAVKNWNNKTASQKKTIIDIAKIFLNNYS